MNEKITVGQMGELAMQSEQGRITREMLQRFLENPLLVLAAVVLNVFERMLAACKFDWVDKNITPENFPITKELAEDTVYELVCLGKDASTDEVEVEIKKRGLESGDMADLLLYVRRNPNKQREFPIVALDSRWQDSDGGWYSPCVSYWFGRRVLNLSWRDCVWGGLCRFLARKPR